ncbi:MAG: glycerophosphodiester phosphodiesterase [Lachnospiraceae bacterium]|nr:glycerophosphodiester phosphodiesterase [Lachnospiraceae bacterium]
MKNFAHRGFSGKYPENTLLAFDEARKTKGCDGIELDVHLSADGIPVIIHDEEVDRTAVSGRGTVKDLTLEQLRRFDLSYTFAGKCERQRIPTLEEYFDLVRTCDLETNIELKTGVYEYPGIEQKTLDLIRAYGMEERIIISSFNHHSVLRFKALAPHIRCGLLSDSWLIDAGAYVKKAGVEYYHPIFNNMTPEYVKDLRDNGIGINVWTVNEPEDVRRMRSVGVDAVIGNFPDRTATVIAEAS